MNSECKIIVTNCLVEILPALLKDGSKPSVSVSQEQRLWDNEGHTLTLSVLSVQEMSSSWHVPTWWVKYVLQCRSSPAQCWFWFDWDWHWVVSVSEWCIWQVYGCPVCGWSVCLMCWLYAGCDDDRKLKVDFKSISCKVCNAPSSGFHFGAITCEGCKVCQFLSPYTRHV